MLPVLKLGKVDPQVENISGGQKEGKESRRVRERGSVSDWTPAVHSRLQRLPCKSTIHSLGSGNL